MIVNPQQQLQPPHQPPAAAAAAAPAAAAGRVPLRSTVQIAREREQLGVSRAKTIAMLAVPQGVSFERLTTEITKGKNFKDRKIEEARLKQLMDVCLLNYQLNPEKYRNLHIDRPPIPMPPTPMDINNN